MATQSLVVSRDPEILGLLRPLMNELGMSMRSCDEHAGALSSLNKEKFDTVIVDCDADPHGYELLTKIRENKAHQKTVAVGITSDSNSMQSLFDSGATFVLSKPLPVEDARRILRISKGVITRVVRRFLRLDVGDMATATLGDNQESIILNVSQKGLAVQAARPLKRGEMIYVTFLLPGTFDLVEGMAEVMWSDILGRSGLEFRALADDMRSMMSRWVFVKAREQNLKLAEPMAAFTEPTAVQMTQRTAIKVATQVIERATMMAGHHSKTAVVIVLGVIVDLIAVGLGTTLFFGFGAIAGYGRTSPSLAIGVGIVLWAIYRFLFFFFKVSSPGEKAVQSVVEAR